VYGKLVEKLFIARREENSIEIEVAQIQRNIFQISIAWKRRRQFLHYQLPSSKASSPPNYSLISRNKVSFFTSFTASHFRHGIKCHFTASSKDIYVLFIHEVMNIKKYDDEEESGIVIQSKRGKNYSTANQMLKMFNG
jgi:hypothetical protein